MFLQIPLYIRLLQEREIVAYCDLHGHSRRQNVFIYGCENRHNAEKRLRERVFPCMLNKNSPDKVNFLTTHSSHLSTTLCIYHAYRKIKIYIWIGSSLIEKITIETLTKVSRLTYLSILRHSLCNRISDDIALFATVKYQWKCMWFHAMYECFAYFGFYLRRGCGRIWLTVILRFATV